MLMICKMILDIGADGSVESYSRRASQQARNRNPVAWLKRSTMEPEVALRLFRCGYFQAHRQSESPHSYLDSISSCPIQRRQYRFSIKQYQYSSHGSAKK
jgi:hypothetical protein